jgi:hypothetical protein
VVSAAASLVAEAGLPDRSAASAGEGRKAT